MQQHHHAREGPAPLSAAMRTVGKWPIVTCIALAVLLAALCVRTWVHATAQSRSRIEREHGVKLPASARHFQCRGDAWVGFLDRGASSVFEMDLADQGAFVAQLRIAPGVFTFIPGNDRYRQFKLPWRKEVNPLGEYSCRSRTGDWLHVQVYPIDGQRVDVWLYTDWN